MAGPSLADNVVLSLLEDIRESIYSGRVSDLNTVQTKLDDAIAELNGKRTAAKPSANDVLGTLALEIGSLRHKIAKCETQLAEFRDQHTAPEEDATQVIAHAATVAAAPVPSPDSTFHQPTSRIAIVSFPGGPRTVTIHPPGSPHFQPIVYDDQGEAIIDFTRRPQPLRRQGAFRGPLEDVDWNKITHVCGRAPDRPPAPSPRWPDRSQTHIPPPPRSRAEIIARAHQLARARHTDVFGRVLPPDSEYVLVDARPIAVSASRDALPCSSGWESSSPPRPSLASLPASSGWDRFTSPPTEAYGARPRSDAWTGAVSLPRPTSPPRPSSPPLPSSPTGGRGQKRAYKGDEEEDTSARTTDTPSARREAARESDAKRSRIRGSPSWEGISRSLSRTYSSQDLSRTV